MARQHLAGDLGIARLIGPDKPKGRESEKEKEGAESGQQQPVGEQP